MTAAVEEMYPASNLHIDFSMKGAILQLKRMFISDELRGMLEWEDYCSLDMVFPHRCISGQQRHSVINTHADNHAYMVLNCVPNVYMCSGQRSGTEAELKVLKREINQIKKLAVHTFTALSFEFWIFTFYTIWSGLFLGLAPSLA